MHYIARRTAARTLCVAALGCLAASGCALSHSAGPTDASRDRTTLDVVRDGDAIVPPGDAPPDSDARVCPMGQVQCGDRCVDNQTDPTACGVSCADCTMRPNVGPGATCMAGRCAIGAACNPGYGDCDGMADNGCETRLGNDVHCARCNDACTGATPVCSTMGATSMCATGCVGAQTRCGGACVDTATNTMHCGMCGRTCPVPPANGVATCTGGTCGVMCAAGFHLCSGMCLSNTSPASCGTSCTPCPAPANGASTCTAGACGIACNAGFGNCNGNMADGCEASFNTDASNCGGCGRVCTAPVGGSAACVAGACMGMCPGGQTNCGGTCRPTGAACMSGGSGGCQTAGTIVCAGASTACSAAPRTSGACAMPAGGQCDAAGNCACPAGTTNCSGTCRTTATDPANCGTCGMTCASGMCMGGVCAPVTCGNRVLDAGETCDDGNTTAGDGCNASCQLEAMPPASACSGSVLTIRSGGAQIYTGNTSGGGTAGTRCAGGAPGDSAPGRIYQIEAMFSGSVRITVSGLNGSHDAILIVRRACASEMFSDQIDCDNDAGPGGDETVTIGWPGGSARFWLIIDGSGGTSGPYTLTFTPL